MPIVKAKKMHRNPFVSAIIAAHNEELHLDACIKSLLSQSYKKMEIIIVENGNSNDRTMEIARSYAKKYKNVRAFSITGKQNGPGNAWNYGIKKAKGKVLIICGADLIYGKDYVKKGIKPVLDGETVGLNHYEEKCNNLHNLWGRAFFYKRICVNKNGLAKVFTIIRKDYVLKRPFDPELGYADDQTIYRVEGTEFLGVHLEVYHTNPSSFKDTWGHSLWVGRSINNIWSNILIILIFPVFPLYSIYKTLTHLKTDFYIPFIWFLPLYYSVRYLAYFKESVKKLFHL